MIQFVAFSLFSLKRPEVFRARRIAKMAKTAFSDTTPPSNIAIAALYIIASQNNLKVTHNDFGITKERLLKSVDTIVHAGNTSQRLKDDLKGFVLNTKSKLSASVK